MNSTLATDVDDDPLPADTTSPQPPAWQRPAAWAVAVAGLSLAWFGGLAGVLGALLAAAAAFYALTSGTTAAAAVAADDPNPAATGPTNAAGRLGAEVMVAQVVPVWSRQLDVTREAAADGLGQVLNTFAEMSGALGTLTDNLSSYAVAADPGAVDGAVRTQSPALDRLLAPSQRAFDQRDAAVAELGRCAEQLALLQELAKRAREIGRHTRLVAFNASIEAQRSGNARDDHSAHAVAMEVRMLAGRIGETGEEIERIVRGLSQSLQRTRVQGEIHDTTPDELRLELDLRAREALAALLGAVGASLQGSAEVQQAAGTLRDQLDAAFVHFQFGDRISQMLAIISSDMTNFVRWVANHPRASQSDAAEWLVALEASYTMEEQRSHHHGNVHVDVSTGVEFF